MSESKAKTILFYRRFRRFSGGHLKVWHYFNHVKASRDFRPRVFFTEGSLWDETNPWWSSKGEVSRSWEISGADALFIGGTGWRAIPEAIREAPGVPVINLVQGLNHADPKNPRFDFLRYRAIRICVNPKVEEALRSLSQVNGPIIHIPMGLDLHDLPRPDGDRNDVAIAAVKAPKLGLQIFEKLRGSPRRIELLSELLPRREYLRKIAESRVTVFLPRQREGFYLPPLEAMAMRRIVVCPDCVSNRVYSRPERNCFQPGYGAEAIACAVESALGLSQEEAEQMRDKAAETAAAYTLEREREAFLGVLSNLDILWNGPQTNPGTRDTSALGKNLLTTGPQQET